MTGRKHIRQIERLTMITQDELEMFIDDLICGKKPNDVGGDDDDN